VPDIPGAMIRHHDVLAAAHDHRPVNSPFCTTLSIFASSKSPQKRRLEEAFLPNTDLLQKMVVPESHIAPHDHPDFQRFAG
jgi:hypothetical protein